MVNEEEFRGKHSWYWLLIGGTEKFSQVKYIHFL